MRILTKDQKKKLKQDQKTILRKNQMELLAEVIKKYHLTNIVLPDIIVQGILKERGETNENLFQALTDEFCTTGLGEDWEPNQRGLLIESIIDAVFCHKK